MVVNGEKYKWANANWTKTEHSVVFTSKSISTHSTPERRKKWHFLHFSFVLVIFVISTDFRLTKTGLDSKWFFAATMAQNMYLSCKFKHFFWWCKMESHMASGLIHMKISTRGKLIECMDIENKSQYYEIRDTVAMGRLIKNAKKTKQITWLFYEDSPKNQIILVANRGIFALPFPWYPLIFSNFVST